MWVIVLCLGPDLQQLQPDIEADHVSVMDVDYIIIIIISIAFSILMLIAFLLLCAIRSARQYLFGGNPVRALGTAEAVLDDENSEVTP